MKSVIDILDLTTDELNELIDTALDIIANPVKYSEVCRGKKLATLFFEPSTLNAGSTDRRPSTSIPLTWAKRT